MTDDSHLAARFPLRLEHFAHGDFAADLILPLAPEDLIDESDFNVDERLPYWAELWPSARALARHLLEADERPPRAIELGCGVGLPSLALRHRGVEVLATDYYPDALLFATHNAERNGLPPLVTQELDWREIDGATPRFPLVVAADVLYEARNVEPLAAALDRLVEPDGSVILADPGRSYLGAFLERVAADGWAVERLGERREGAGRVRATVSLFGLRRGG